MLDLRFRLDVIGAERTRIGLRPFPSITLFQDVSMKLRETLATYLPPLFRKAQRASILPDPYYRSLRITDPNLPCERRIVGVYRPAKLLVASAISSDSAVEYDKKINDAGRFYDTEHTFGYYDARHARVWPKFGVHLVNRQTFRDVYCGPALSNPKYEFARLSLLYSPTMKKKEAVFLAPSWYHNYYHWMIDILPRLQIVVPELQRGTPLIVPSDLTAVQQEALKLALDFLDLKDIELIRLPSAICEFERLVMPTAMSMPLDVSPLQRLFIRGIVPIHNPSKRRRIYITRRDASVRRIVNEPEVERILSQYGFEIIALSGLNLHDQAELFRGAEAIIGHHGAGFTNLVFCEPTTLALEIFQDGHFAPSFARLSQLGNLKYGYLVGKPKGFDTWVDPNQLECLIRNSGLTLV